MLAMKDFSILDFFCSKDRTRVALCGIFHNLKEGYYAATDGHIIAFIDSEHASYDPRKYHSVDVHLIAGKGNTEKPDGSYHLLIPNKVYEKCDTAQFDYMVYPEVRGLFTTLRRIKMASRETHRLAPMSASCSINVLKLIQSFGIIKSDSELIPWNFLHESNPFVNMHAIVMGNILVGQMPLRADYLNSKIHERTEEEKSLDVAEWEKMFISGGPNCKCNDVFPKLSIPIKKPVLKSSIKRTV